MIGRPDRGSCVYLGGAVLVSVLASQLEAQIGTVDAEQTISETVGGFGGILDVSDHFGVSVASLGDLDGDGVTDIAVGAWFDDDGGSEQGAVWILFLKPDGTVASEQKISEATGGFGGLLDPGDEFGRSVTSLGDLDGDGVTELAVGADGDDDGASNQGAVWILFLNADGTVAAQQKISELAGGFGGALDLSDKFGSSVTSLGDLDGDGVRDLAVGAPGVGGQGAVWVLFLQVDGTVASEQEIREATGGFGGVLDPGDVFGVAVASLGDLDGDCVTDLVVGALGDDDGGSTKGAVWILFLNLDGTVSSEQKISETAGGFRGVLDVIDEFGNSVASLGDVDGNGVTDIAVGTWLDDDGGSNQGAVWILFLNADGTVASEQKVSETTGGFGGVLDSNDRFGASIASVGDLDGNGAPDLAVGAQLDDDGGTDQGAVWILFLAGPVVDYGNSRFFGPRAPVILPAVSESLSPQGADVAMLDLPPDPLAVSSEGTAHATRPAHPLAFSEPAIGGNSVAWEFTPPTGEAIVMFEARFATSEEPRSRASNDFLSVDLSDGASSVNLFYADTFSDLSERNEDGRFATEKTIWADLEALFLEARAETRYSLTVQVGNGAEDERPSHGEVTGIRFHGGARLRPGTGVNALSFVSASTPTVGEPWTGLVDASAQPDASATWILVTERATQGSPGPWGELLIDLTPESGLLQSIAPVCSRSLSVHTLSIPDDPALRGRSFHAQAVVVGEPLRLTNAVELTVVP